MSGRGRLGNSKKVTSMELVELRNGTLILGLRFNLREPSIQFGLCPAA